jgi:heptosyltransferase-2
MICLAPGAGYDQAKRWPPEYFARFIAELHAKRPCRFVLVGDRSEMAIGDAITELVEFQIDNVIGLTTLGCLVQILKQSQLLVSNDNGVMHLGGAVGIPTIGLFGPSNPKVFSPLGSKSTVIAASSGNMTDIGPKYVVKITAELME